MTQAVKQRFKDVEIKICRWLINPWAVGIAFKKIYIKEKYWYTLSDAEKEEVLKHEYYHIISQRKQGSLRWLIKYIFSNSFRLQEEIGAYLPNIYSEIKRTGNKSMVLKEYASILSGDTYLDSIKYEKALKMLIKTII